MRRAAVLVAAVLGGIAAPARAETVVVESYAGRRPQDAGETLAPLFDELRSLGYVTPSAELAHRVDEKVSRPAGPMPAADLADTTRLVDGGWRAWLDGDLEPAVEQLAQGLARLQASPATVAQSPELRDSIHRALVGLALARKRQGRADDAAAHMAELVRSFPDRDFDRTRYGPEAHDLYRKVKGELEQQPRGRVRVVVDDESVVVFLNERYDSVGGGEKELVPGRYRVYVQKGSTPGRLRVVDVAPGGKTEVRIGWRLDAALHSGDGFVGFVFGGPRERDEHEATAASTLGRTLGATAVVVVSIDTYEGRRAILGRVLSVDSARPSRVAVVALEPARPGEASIRGLGRFLADGTPGPGIIVPNEELPEPGADPPRWYTDWLGWSLTAGGLALAGAGVAFTVKAGSLRDEADGAGDEGRVRSLRDRADRDEVLGYVGIGLGAALAVSGIVKLVLHD
jgi:hypothetical protein